MAGGLVEDVEAEAALHVVGVEHLLLRVLHEQAPVGAARRAAQEPGRRAALHEAQPGRPQGRQVGLGRASVPRAGRLLRGAFQELDADAFQVHLDDPVRLERLEAGRGDVVVDRRRREPGRTLARHRDPGRAVRVLDGARRRRGTADDGADPAPSRGRHRHLEVDDEAERPKQRRVVAERGEEAVQVVAGDESRRALLPGERCRLPGEEHVRDLGGRPRFEREPQGVGEPGDLQHLVRPDVLGTGDVQSVGDQRVAQEVRAALAGSEQP